MLNEKDVFAQFNWYTAFTRNLLEKREIIPFHDNWEYQAEPCLDPLFPESFSACWKPVKLPHDYSIEGVFSPENKTGPSGGFVQSGIVWYRKSFFLPDSIKGKKVFIQFDGISANSEIWINGFLSKHHPYGFSPIHLDATPHLNFGAENSILVKCDTSLQPFSRFYQGTGIYRSVDLIITSPLHVDDFGVRYTTGLSADQKTAVVDIDTTVRVAAYEETVWHDFGSEPNTYIEKDCHIVTDILDQNGVIVSADTAVTIPEFTKKTVSQRITVCNPKLWSCESPNLYFIHTRVQVDGVTIDDYSTTMGIRTIEYGAEGLKINRVPVKLKGVCLHQDCGLFGSNVPPKIWIKKLLMMKRMGANAIRTAHHPFPKEFYDLCDIIGLFIMDEAFDEWKKGWERDASEDPYGKNTYGYYQYFEAWCEIDLKLMVKRDRNHPSVILWSMGNEIPDFYYDEGIQTLKRLVKACKEEDISRPTTMGAEGQYRLPLKDEIMEIVDIAGYNYINLKHPDYYTSIHDAHPLRTVVSSETFFEPQHWEFIERNSYAIGQFLWAGYDYLGEAGANNYNNNPVIEMSRNFDDIVSLNDPNYGGTGSSFVDQTQRLMHGLLIGMVDIIDIPRGEYYYRQSLWSLEPVVHIGVKSYEWDIHGMWKMVPALDSWNYKEGEKKTVYCFTNCETVKLYLNGRLIAVKEKKPRDIFPMEIPVDFEEGKLECIGYCKGKEQCRHELQTSYVVHHLNVTCDYSSLKADNSDYASITVSLEDKNGNLVFDDDRKIKATITSGARSALVYRTGNGNMWNRNSYCDPETETFNGHALVIVKSRMHPGKATVAIECEGLSTVFCELDILRLS